MPRTPRVWNKSRVIMEDAKKEKCPRCRGFGGISSQDKGDECFLCKGYGSVMMSVEGTGWCRPPYAKSEQSQLY